MQAPSAPAGDFRQAPPYRLIRFTEADHLFRKTRRHRMPARMIASCVAAPSAKLARPYLIPARSRTVCSARRDARSPPAGIIRRSLRQLDFASGEPSTSRSFENPCVEQLRYRTGRKSVAAYLSEAVTAATQPATWCRHGPADAGLSGATIDLWSAGSIRP
jgi:hypothetical protein